MKRIPSNQAVALAILFVFFWVAWAPNAVAGKLVNTGRFGSTAIKGYDPVAYFTEGKAVKGSKEFTHKHKGATWRFASAGHRDLFAADPMKYAPQYGGWCAYAMADGKKVKINPKAWQIHNGKLYLNYNTKIQNTWLSERERRIADADAKWGGIVAQAQK